MIRNAGGAASSLALLVLAGGALPAEAAMHSVTESASYTLSDTDSRNDGRQKCSDNAKRIALDKAGSVFEAEMTSLRRDPGNNSAQIKMRSTFAAVVSSKTVSEEMIMWGDHPVVSCAVEITYDPDVVSQKMHDLADAEGLRRQVAEQKAQIAQLEDQVREASQPPAPSAPAPQTYAAPPQNYYYRPPSGAYAYAPPPQVVYPYPAGAQYVATRWVVYRPRYWVAYWVGR